MERNHDLASLIRKDAAASERGRVSLEDLMAGKDPKAEAKAGVKVSPEQFAKRQQEIKDKPAQDARAAFDNLFNQSKDKTETSH